MSEKRNRKTGEQMMKKTAVITGADGGMGSEITKAVALAGSLRWQVIM